MIGVVIGRFMPPHRGHQYLIDFSRGMVDRLYVLVCTLSWEPIPGDLRFRWMQELCPSCTVVHITEEIPEARRDNPGAPAIWADTIRRYVPEPVTHVFASEDYGWNVASEMGAAFVPVDPARHSIPVSASAIRANPFGNWEYIPQPVRPYFVRHVAVLDAPELARTVARKLGTVVVESYGRFVETSIVRGTIDTPTVEAAQRSALAALSRQADRVVVHSVRSEEWDRYQTVTGVRYDLKLSGDNITDAPADHIAAEIAQTLDRMTSTGP